MTELSTTRISGVMAGMHAYIDRIDLTEGETSYSIYVAAAPAGQVLEVKRHEGWSDEVEVQDADERERILQLAEPAIFPLKHENW